MKTIIIKTLGDLLDKTTPEQPDQASGRLRPNSVFRGVANSEGRLLTSLDRLGGIEPPHTKLHLEEHLLRNFIRFGRQFLSAGQSDLWEIMITAEHHGLPTRLLDWTHSPLVAAHFATLPEKPGEDRVVWQLNWKMVHRKFGLPEVSFLVDDLDQTLTERGFARSWEFLKEKQEGKEHFVCLLDPTATTERVAVQSGAFTLATEKGRSLDEILESAGLEGALTRFVIPTKCSQHIRDQLDLCTVDERRLFPGLDAVAAELRRYYSSSGGLDD